MSGEEGQPSRRKSLAEDRPVGSAEFLPKETYRRRRIVDALRIWPLVGLVFLVLPAAWDRGEFLTTYALLYIFLAWAILIVGNGVLSWLAATRLDEAKAEVETGEEEL